MKEFLQLMRRFVSPYKKYIGWAVLLNIYLLYSMCFHSLF